MRQRLRQGLVGGVLVLLLSWVLMAPGAIAAIRQLEEAPGQVLYQSHQSLKDQYGNSWQLVVFKRIHPDGIASVDLRLVGFPGRVDIDRTQPLTLTNSLGKTLTALDSSQAIFQDRSPQPNVGQYDLQPLLPQLQVEIPLELAVPLRNGAIARLAISPLLIQEWTAIADRTD